MIEDFGWSPALQQQFAAYDAENLWPARVIVQQRGLYHLVTPLGEMDAQLSGRFIYRAGEGGLPVAGDWVAVSVQTSGNAAIIHHMLPRRTAFIRKAAGNEQTPQTVAANIDVVLIVTSLNSDFNLRRLERTLAIAWESGAIPAIVLTKADLCDNAEYYLTQVSSIAPDITVLAVSVVTGQGISDLKRLVPAGKTAVVLGSSGVGKSTLVNALMGANLMAIQGIRASDERGKHTTTHRELLLLPEGGALLDTPGMRELGLWDSEEGLSTTFTDIDTLISGCRFTNCGHMTELGCAIQDALSNGVLDEHRWQSFRKLQREMVNQKLREARRPVSDRRKKKEKHPPRRREKPNY